MTHVAITMLPGRDDEAKKALAMKQDIPIEEWKQSMERIPKEIMFVQPQEGFN
ncbi:hypothetical protein LQE92_09720 [Lacrimispora sp. NSJ-141]|uniref:Uncharacterized protein n=1 Tax=Lientehia hominis TaxID=2897778 RepID=A0AAP2RK35_9FIRM|nr:hypothetical protein [Lientehia hominis]MCD2492904.1 hypothetical protein [Lientehia hominis]